MEVEMPVTEVALSCVKLSSRPSFQVADFIDLATFMSRLKLSDEPRKVRYLCVMDSKQSIRVEEV